MSATTPVTKSPRKARKPRPAKPSRKRTPKFILFLRWLVMIITVLCGAGLVAASYGGYINPVPDHGMWGVVGLCMPFFLAGMLLLLILQLLVWRRGAIVPGVFLLVCAGPILNYCPLHIFTPKAAPEAKTFKVMTYNVLGLNETHPKDSIGCPRNRSLNAVIESGADLVCLQESPSLKARPDKKVNPEDLLTLNRLYPYILRSNENVILLSKYPVEDLHINYQRSETGADIAGYRVNIDGLNITVFNVHLQSIGLDENDFDVYNELSHAKKQVLDDLHEVRYQLWSKVSYANVVRGMQAQKLSHYIERLGGPNVLVCGDFNDVANCYAIRELEGAGLREVYPAVGFGPIITYNARRFFFGIDHILWRGRMKPLSLKKEKINSSDHYPLIAEFEILSDK